MTPKQVSLVQASWQKVLPIAPQAADIFYRTLFEMDPALKTLFPSDITEQGKKLMAMLDTAVKLLDEPDKLIPAVQKLGARHVQYGTKPEHYDTVGAALLKTLAIGLDKEFTAAVKKAWTAVYKTLATTMIEAAADVGNETSEKGSIMDMKTDKKNNLAIQLQGALNQSATAFIMIDRDFNITYANDATLALLKKHEATFADNWPGFKADPDIIIGTNIDSFHKNPAHQRKMLDDPSNLPFKTDIHIRHLTFQLNVAAIMDATGSYIGNSLEWQDVTVQRAAEVQNADFAGQIEAIDKAQAVISFNLDGTIIDANENFLSVLGYRLDEIQGKHHSIFVDEEYKQSSEYRAFWEKLNRGEYESNEYKRIGKGGKDVWIQASYNPIKDLNGNVFKVVKYATDITAQVQAIAQIDELVQAAVKGVLDNRIDTSGAQGFIASLGSGINNLMEAVVAPVTDAINVAQALADGDLTQNMRNDYGGEFLALANAMNGSIDNLSNMVDEIRTAATNVFDSSREIAQGNNELSHRTESQASSLEETASAMEELTSTVQQNAENSTEASKLSNSVMKKATNGGSVVRNAITAMSDINKSSKKIADIISVIDEIAFQTNLLALNAAVEAARAGEQGRGFAVVAAEVRNLAQRSAAAAKEIKGLINDSVEAVGQGTKLVDETGKTFSELVTSIEEVSSMISDIDSAGKEQSAGIGEVSAAVSQMDEMTQQNAALVEEAAASSQSMEEQSQALLDQVAFFNNGAEDEVPQVESPVKSKARAPAKRANKVKAKSVPRIQTASDQEWEEF